MDSRQVNLWLTEGGDKLCPPEGYPLCIYVGYTLWVTL